MALRPASNTAIMVFTIQETSYLAVKPGIEQQGRDEGDSPRTNP
jgi:hypothetical protein